MNQPRFAFIDWMKCLGMAVIVYGHTAGHAVMRVEPFNPKQLGVAFFLFALGFSLSREQRPTPKVLYNRLFDIYFIGLIAAAILSICTWISVRDLAESNYSPFVLGANVIFPNFPANPTTWYIGTYIHVLLIWAIVLRRIPIRPWMLVVSLAIEVASRAALIHQAGEFIAYMFLTNWMTVFLAGMYSGQGQAQERIKWNRRQIGVLAVLAALVLSWLAFGGAIGIEQGFPFSTIQFGESFTSLLATSAAISFLYLSITLLAFAVTSRLPNVGFVRFLARNTLIVFIAHMPVLYLLHSYVGPIFPNQWLRAAVNMVIYYLILAAISEGIMRVVPTRAIRDRLYALVANWAQGSRSEPRRVEVPNPDAVE